MSSRLASEGSVGQDDITRANSTIAVLLKTNRYEWMTNPNLYDAACARPNTPAAGSNVHNAMSVDKGANDSASTIIKRSPDRPSQINNSVSPTGLPLPDGSSVTGSSPPTSASQTPSNKTPQPPGARNNKGTARPQLKSRTNSKGKSISSVDINPCQFQSLNSPSTPSASTNPKSPGANTITPPKKRTSKQPSAKYVCPPAEDPRWNIWTIGRIASNAERKALGLHLPIIRKVLRNTDQLVGAVPSDRMRLNSEQILPLISVRRAGLEKRGVRPTKWNPELTWEKWVLKEGGIADMGEVKVLETEERAGKWKKHLSSSSQNEEEGRGLGGAKKLKRGAAKTPAAAGLGREGPGSGSCGKKCPREDEEIASPRAGKRRGSMASVVGAGYAVAMREVEMLADIDKLLEQGEEKEKEEEQVRSEEE